MEMSVLSILSTVFSAVGSLMQADSKADASEYNAKIAQQNAAMATQQAEADAAEQKRDTVRKLGAMRAGYGASGVAFEGSPLDILAQSASDAEMDRLNIIYKGKVRAAGYDANAELYESNAENERNAGLVGAGRSVVLGLDKTRGPTGTGTQIPDSVQYYDDWNWGSS